MNQQSKVWTYTINNYSDAELERIDGLYDGGGLQYHIRGLERGDNGTPHIQGFIRFSTKKRFGGVKAAIGDRGHIERARGTDQQNRTYCSKDGDFREWGSPISGRGGTGDQFTHFRDWCKQYFDDTGAPPTERDIADAFPALYVRYRRNVLDLSLAVCPSAEYVFPEETLLRGWQRTLYDRLSEEADDRTVEFFIDSEGGKGKTWFQQYMLATRSDIQCLGIGKRDDLAFAVDPEARIFLFNIPRGGMEYLQYTILEQLKDRIVFSTKYQSQTKKLRHRPHVVVFTNEEVDKNAMSRDRYKITRLI